MNRLITVEETKELIASGQCLSLAGAECLLDQLPAGNWIGGTTPYFITEDGGVVSQDMIFATTLSELGQASVAHFAAEELAGICANAPENGFALTIIPAGSKAHKNFAADAGNFEGAFLRPTVGWIAGVHLSELGHSTPKVYDGRGPHKYEDMAVVAYVALPEDKLASIEIINLFEPEEGDVLRFHDTNFEVDECEVNGERTNFSEYIRQRGLDHGHLPLVGDFGGAHLNVSLQHVASDHGKTQLYAPVFAGVDYRFAKPVTDYAAAFQVRLNEQQAQGQVMSCNCILNFVFGDLEGKSIGGLAGPVTFGEIAYQLLNQTLVVLRIH
ncbi:DUF6976 family protein [Herbaspirillum rubrisubalbicans]|uniref:Uncharacterized protein n=1 Tax=Herbaspirillum rubrisubalbicans TaxID=80842 RepID=A0AAD0UB69_9BURK|nr:hypothetical protein [Herbaspirillum rubrisubalbicans]ALU88659.1 hypothetical protein Hrubri_1450 [Herbaspirillum rubrisubalbicans M1]AYR23709.1 hypothetical protein RC54_07650 [Herbaspirillum rubrisubalbicans]